MTPADAPPTLEALRGLHLPNQAAGAISGEVVVAILAGFAAALLVGLVRYLRVRARATVRRAALRDLAAARNLDPEARLVAQARLLRRVARTVQGEDAASAQGTAWAHRLDGLFATTFFTAGAGRVLAEELYRRSDRPDPAVLDAELGRLIGRMRG
ncbi:DUF4381 domain-containing protein [Methylobacterium sp. WL30]|uniref:DUF4381 family protein n=2 Tax=Methylobacterium TaxID=407 RepID=UPI0011C9FE02|nr:MULTISPECIES: DUF4381 family protein [unclassified Methylobacterium]TXN17325.1 DUF4381 domain-containing protein [Methylobacterium sp. WL93]TXN43631.1 DUF4381 domain-containing protein [Methylobacterium sp. WL119]TXN63313.1 DUF4381 domain-containing protein [Methylobacterium sp. WL30]